MKLIVLNFVFFLTLFTCFSSFGQLEQGTFVINERFDFHTTTTKNKGSNYENKQTNFSTTTSFGYLFKENQEVGISLVYGRNKISSQDNGFGNDATIQDYGFGIYYKRYINIVDKLSFFVSPQLGYLSTQYSGSEYNGNQIGANIYTGILYHPTKKIGLSMNLVGAGINYSYRKQSMLQNNSFSLSNFGGLNLALQFMF
ncbi:hypothetical protein Fleli_2762 [Bernardetia litoralis DSM 6794]|uniref:Outer membrane protein beta-barrel domain-containing protein n=1 Tax=Bernardetia litoralis (strain ATCC 23117 / DSM 6794 / NBRC 15988 / NCIMB 1366 / Fx l1 / Sio-4) TaxID=880071 RepID=I4AMD0_BERLS|nr:hypothetical protein [Bernardetia litoralis]AFM05115.1 hypothetical protein Fleli_2762 [Bernardetia litoralis DSM 6794]